jgi:hypothetical protein
VTTNIVTKKPRIKPINGDKTMKITALIIGALLIPPKPPAATAAPVRPPIKV